MDGIIFALDIGTTKVCALVGEVRDHQLQIIGVGIEPSKGMRLGMVVDVNEAAVAIAKAIELAEQSSGYELSRALVSMAGEHLESTNSVGRVTIGRKDEEQVEIQTIERALQKAISDGVPESRQIVHVVPRSFSVDSHRNVASPIGMVGEKLEIEAHIVTAEAVSIKNLDRCVQNVGISAEEYVLNVLASAEAVLDRTEREMGVLVADIGGGTTDIALYTDGSVWHTDVLPSGGQRVTNDVAIGLRVPFDVAEGIKLRYGDCRPAEIDPDNVFTITPFGGENIVVGWQDLAYVIEARVEQLFEMMLESIKRSGYDGLLPAGIVLTGGGARLKGITSVAERVLGVPARVAQPKNLVGLVDQLQSPAHATAVGLLHWSVIGHNAYQPKGTKGKARNRREAGRRLGRMLKVFLPD